MLVLPVTNVISGWLCIRVEDVTQDKQRKLFAKLIDQNDRAGSGLPPTTPVHFSPISLAQITTLIFCMPFHFFLGIHSFFL
ncbi:hypothetical protein CA13_73440 [Planctomycetes bacterium CA13]|uniref:Uncharacterized protein n=1 Tax=Novipirellula herctigrandis TaxID=2527986 RepID=A0A5C5YLH4_9BACT|nr:hypothetical protein CA13_73440 [Planctomycetes bacterium CA13]